MTHHTWKARFGNLLRSRNWKKVGFHVGIEYSIIGAFWITLENDPRLWPIGLGIAIIVHFTVFQMIDALHEKDVKHKWIPKWLHWLFEHDHR